MSDKTYNGEITCSNCKYFMNKEIPKGMTVREFIKNNTITCENCGCDKTKVRFIPRW